MGTDERQVEPNRKPSQEAIPQDDAQVPDLALKEVGGQLADAPASDAPKDGTDAEKAAGSPEAQHQGVVAKEEYSVFTTGQKRAIIAAGSFIGWFSPMGGAIYFPALNSIAADLHVTPAKVNVTVTTYLILQGLAPMMIAGFSDKAGRRLAYGICFLIYFVANLGLALQNSYIALLLLRMLQAAGSSGTIALANGLVGDLVTSAERGKYIAYASIGTLLGPSLSPILGGLLSQYLGWHWIFWFLLILGAVAAVPTALFLPETCRKIVGDGSVPPPWPAANISDTIRFRNRAKKGIPVDAAKQAALRANFRFVIPNPFDTLKVLADLESGIILLSTGLALACFYAISTGASTAFGTLYGFNDLYISLMFLPIGAGGVISAFTTGKLVDWNYARVARRLNFPVVRTRETDLSNFPIEMARIQVGLPTFLVAGVAIIGYGWMLEHRVSLAGPIIMLLLLGYCLIAGFQCLNVLMVDIYPGQPATATAANNITRCLLGAAASAAIVPMSNAMGKGWAYTVLAVLFLASCAGPIWIMKDGVRLRRVRKEKAERRKRAREAKKEAKEQK